MADKSTRDNILELIKTVREVALKKSEVDPKEIAKELVKAIREEVTGFETQIIQMRKLEQAGVKKSEKPELSPICKSCKEEMSPVDYVQSRPHGSCKKCSGLAKSVFNLLPKPAQSSPLPSATPSVIPGQPNAPQLAQSEPMIDLANEHNPEKRETEKNANPKAKLPSDKKSKKINVEGNGGQLKKDTLSATSPVAKPSGLNVKPPVATAPALKPEGVPGAKAGMAPGTPKPPSAPGAAKPTFGKADELEKGFVKPVREGTKVQQQKQDLAWVGNRSPAVEHAQKKNPAWKPPTMAEHSQRAAGFADFTPPGKFG